MFLREVVLGALEAGALARRDGVWRWVGEPGGAPRLTELVEARLSGLGAEERDALELLACGEPLTPEVVESLVRPDALAAAERHGLLVVERERRRRAYRLAHPVYGEVLRARLPYARARALWGRLAEALEATGLRRRDDLLRAAAWRTDAGAPAKPELLVAAAREATVAFDFPLAERLARAAQEAGGGWAASRALAEALELQARHGEAEAVLAGGEAVADTDQERAEWTVARATNLFWGLERADEAGEVLGRAEARLEGGPNRAVVATMAMVALFEGRCADAVELCDQVLAEDAPADQAALWALVTAVPANALSGRFGRALDLADRGDELVRSLDEAQPWSEAQLGWGRCQALQLSGRLAEAEALAEAGYRVGQASRSTEITGAWAAFRGVVAAAQGRVATAEASLREAVALLGDDPYRFLRVCLASLAAAAGLSGDLAAADWALSDADARESGANRVFDPMVELARAWVALAHGEVARAGELAAAAGELARERELWTLEAQALHDVARLGRPGAVAARLAELAGRVEGPLAPLQASHAAALARSDGVALDAAAAGFEALGAWLLAAEAANQAAAAHRDAGRRASAAASSARARAFAERCEGARTPALEPPEATAILTRREREVAGLAAAGLPSRTIAVRLGVSVRTVDNHLANAYLKLGVPGRAGLARVLHPIAP